MISKWNIRVEFILQRILHNNHHNFTIWRSDMKLKSWKSHTLVKGCIHIELLSLPQRKIWWPLKSQSNFSKRLEVLVALIKSNYILKRFMIWYVLSKQFTGSVIILQISHLSTLTWFSGRMLVHGTLLDWYISNLTNHKS